MEGKINFIDNLLDKWTNLTDKKKLSYLTSIIIASLCSIIYFGYIHYENKIVKLVNEKIELKNEYIISINSINARHDAMLDFEREKFQKYMEKYLEYVERNEKEVKDILFYTKKYNKELE